MRWLRRAAAAAALLTLSTMPWSGANAAPRSVPIQTGTWFIGQLVGVPAPPTVPVGGLWISGTILGPYAFSAVRFTLPPDQSDPVLSLKVSRLTSAPATPLGTGQNPIVACATTSGWKPTGNAPGSWAVAPKYDCSKGELTGALSNDGTTLSFELGSIVRPGQTLSLAFAPGTISNPIPPLVPVPLPLLPTPPQLPLGLSIPNPTAGQLNATFDATFQALTAASLQTATVTASPVVTVPPAPAPDAGSSTFLASPPAPIDQPTATAATPIPAVVPEGVTAPSASNRQVLAVAAPTRKTTDDAGHRVLAALLLGLFVGLGLQQLGRRHGTERLTLYDIPPADAARPATSLSRIKRD